MSSSVEINAIPLAQELDLGSLLHGHHVDTVTLVRPDVEALPIRNRPIVLVAVPLYEPRRDIRDGDDGSPRASHQLREDFQELRFDQEPAVCD